jgi:hypothetical protein
MLFLFLVELDESCTEELVKLFFIFLLIHLTLFHIRVDGYLFLAVLYTVRVFNEFIVGLAAS